VARRTQRYEDALTATREVVNRHDPIALVQLGQPDDEYGPEIADLVRLVLSDEPIEPAAVDGVWVRWFGDDYTMAGSERLASLTNGLIALQSLFGPM
jgi:hypothetical protein